MRRLFFHEESIHEVSRRYLEHEYIHTHTHTHTYIHTDKPKPICPPLFQSWGHKKDAQGIPPLKKRNGGGVAQSESEKAAEFNGQFTDVFT